MRSDEQANPVALNGLRVSCFVGYGVLVDAALLLTGQAAVLGRRLFMPYKDRVTAAPHVTPISTL